MEKPLENLPLPEAPPILGTWANVYIFVVVCLGAMIGGLYWFSTLY
jgi:hypothetical protein